MRLDFFIPHQANIRIIDSAAKRLHMPMEKYLLIYISMVIHLPRL